MLSCSLIPMHELTQDQTRLDAFYYAGGGRSALQKLLASGHKLERLDEVAVPPYMGDRFARSYVQDPGFGCRFLGPSEMQLADLSGLPSVSLARTRNLDSLLVHQGWILISRSGAIGNFAYVRQEMDGLVGSDDIIRVVARPGRILSGYLFAFLQSPVGLALLRRSTYGAVIQHIEPHHIAGLPIPRLEGGTESAIHDLIESAAAKRTEANVTIDRARRSIYKATGLAPIDRAPVGRNLCGYRWFTVAQSSLQERLEARYHDGLVRQMRSAIDATGTSESLSELTLTIYEEHRHKLWDAENGLPFVGTGEMFAAKPRPHRYLSPRIPGIESLVVDEGTILVAKSGQIYSILGDVVMVGRTLRGKAVSWHALRIIPNPTRLHPGYLCAFLSTPDYGYGQIVSTAYGTSIPEISTEDVKRLRVPIASRDSCDRIGGQVLRGLGLRDEANDLEDEAQRLLADALGVALGSTD